MNSRPGVSSDNPIWRTEHILQAPETQEPPPGPWMPRRHHVVGGEEGQSWPTLTHEEWFRGWCWPGGWEASHPHGNIHLLLQNRLNFQRMEVVQYSLLLLALFSYAVIIFVQINNEETFTAYTHNPWTFTVDLWTYFYTRPLHVLKLDFCSWSSKLNLCRWMGWIFTWNPIRGSAWKRKSTRFCRWLDPEHNWKSITMVI